MDNFFQVFVISRNTKILIELNYWLGMSRGAIHYLFKCTHSFNKYLISVDYVSDFNDLKTL